MGRVQVFHVNETLLDLAAMDSHFERIFADPGVRVTWFSQMISSALVATVTGVYHQFGAHAMAALEMTAEQAGVQLADDDKQAVAAQLRQLPAHPEVASALGRLGDAGKPLWPRIDSELKNHFDYTEGALGANDYFVANRFSAADIHLSFILDAGAARGPLSGYPCLTALHARLKARPAYQRAIERGGPYELGR